MKVVGYHTVGNVVANSDGEMITEDRLTWLARQPQDTIKIFYDLDYAVAQIAKTVGMAKGQAEILLDTGNLYWAPYRIGYIPGKYFSVRENFYQGAPFASFSDASQYLDKTDFIVEDTPKYCIAKAKEAQAVGEQVLQTLETIGLHPTSLTSPINAYSKEILEKMDLPTIDDLPPKAAEYAYQCCHGNWVETFIRGHWDKVWDYDITSAYPYQLSKLLDTRYGKWENYPLWLNGTPYGYCKGIVTIDGNFSPIIYDGKINYTPVGSWECCLTKQEIEFIRTYGIGDFEIHDAWWWVVDKEVMPLKNHVLELQQHKLRASGLKKEVIKRVMSGIWGKFLELRHEEMGPMFNPVWGADVEARTRLKVANLCLSNKAMPIAVAVDGVTLDRPVELHDNGRDFGAWKLSAECPCLSISTGVVALKEKYSGLDFSLDYDWLMKQARANPKTSNITMQKLSPMTVAKAVQSNRWEDVGKLEIVSRTIDLRSESKRLYKEEPGNWKELISNKYTSSPLDVSMVSELSLV